MEAFYSQPDKQDDLTINNTIGPEDEIDPGSDSLDQSDSSDDEDDEKDDDEKKEEEMKKKRRRKKKRG
jgi:hypothetical protein